MKGVKIIFKEFLQMEQELNLFNKTISGVRFWERIRAQIFLSLFERQSSGKERSSSRQMGGKLKFYIRALIDIRKNPYLSRPKDVLFVGSSRRIRMPNGFWSDIYVDPIIEKLHCSSVCIEYDLMRKHKEPPRTQSLKYFDFIKVFGSILMRLGVGKVEYTKRDISLLETIEDAIYKRFDYRVKLKNRVIKNIHRWRAFTILYKLLLRWIKPKVLVLICSYGKEALIDAAKTLGIATIELQHGVISPYHPGYVFPDGVTKTTFPDFILTFGEYWKKSVNYPIPKSHVVSAGFPYLESKRASGAGSRNEREILFISQERSGVLISKFAVQLSRLLSNDFKVVYKLHPLETDRWKKLYPWLVESNIEVVGTERDLYELFKESKVQVGIFSTALFEGLSFGLSTFLINAPGIEYFEPLIEMKVVHVVSTPEDLVKMIRRGTLAEEFDVNFFFKPNGIQNIVSFICDKVNEMSN